MQWNSVSCLQEKQRPKNSGNADEYKVDSWPEPDFIILISVMLRPCSGVNHGLVFRLVSLRHTTQALAYEHQKQKLVCEEAADLLQKRCIPCKGKGEHSRLPESRSGVCLRSCQRL